MRIIPLNLQEPHLRDHNLSLGILIAALDGLIKERKENEGIKRMKGEERRGERIVNHQISEGGLFTYDY